MSTSPPRRSHQALFAIITGTLILALGAWAVSAGYADPAIAFLDRSVDTQVVLLFVPLCAIVLAIVVQVVRTIATGAMPGTPKRSRPLPRDWQGKREG